MHATRIIRLSEGDSRRVRFLSDRVDTRALSGGRRQVWVTVTRTGTFNDPRYGTFEITRDMLLSMVTNFDAGVYGQEIVLDVAHQPAAGAAGFFRRLAVECSGQACKLRGLVDLTDYGVEAIQKRGFIYLSAEYAENFQTNEEPRRVCGPTLIGAGLTPRPVVKHLDPIQLSETDPARGPLLVSDRIVRFLSEETQHMKELLKKLREMLAQKKLAEAVNVQLCTAFEKAAEPLATDELRRTLMENFVTAGEELAKQLAEGAQPQTIQLSIGGPTGLSEADVTRLMEQAREAEAKQLAEQTQARDTRVAQFNKLLEEAKLEGLTDEERKELSAAADLITPTTTEEQVRKLAEHTITAGNRLASARQLTGMGFPIPGATGNVQIQVNDQTVLKLQEEVDQRLGFKKLSDAVRYKATGGTLPPANKQLADQVLRQYDAVHGARLADEAKKLSGGVSSMGDVAVPATFERTVIREALYRLVGLQFVDVGVLPFAVAHQIPYSYRDQTAAGLHNTRTYAGGSIQRAGVKQEFETAYPLPQKIAFEVLDEVRYLTTNGQFNWDAVSENANNAVRVISEDTEQLIFNEILQASDEYLAAHFTENVAGVDGAKNVFALTHWPVVRPRKLFDLAGAQIGNTINPVTFTVGGVPVAEYSGQTAAGTYYVLNYNTGEFYLVDQTGALVTPANATPIVADAYQATNVYRFDTDLGADAVDDHWNKFLYRYGLRKSVIEDERYHMCDFGLMSGAVRNQIEQAKQFSANFTKPGTDLAADGNLGRIKAVPNFKTSAPGLWMGDQRVLMGERNQTRFRMMKPWSMGQLENQRDANGRFTGRKEAYGDQFIVLHTPEMLKRAYTSIALYSGTARVTRTGL